MAARSRLGPWRCARVPRERREKGEACIWWCLAACLGGGRSGVTRSSQWMVGAAVVNAVFAASAPESQPWQWVRMVVRMGVAVVAVDTERGRGVAGSDQSVSRVVVVVVVVVQRRRRVGSRRARQMRRRGGRRKRQWWWWCVYCARLGSNAIIAAGSGGSRQRRAARLGGWSLERPCSVR